MVNTQVFNSWVGEEDLKLRCILLSIEGQHREYFGSHEQSTALYTLLYVSGSLTQRAAFRPR
jgi:hypothetical protein